jgi:hypothetical protein
VGYALSAITSGVSGPPLPQVIPTRVRGLIGGQSFGLEDRVLAVTGAGPGDSLQAEVAEV